MTELLVMIGVIGVLTALVVGRLAGVAGEAREVTDRRNAQNIAMVAAVADTLGSDRLALAADLETAVRLVAGGSGGGLTIGDRGRGVAVSGLSAGELQGALRFLRFEKGKVVYTGGGPG